MKNRVITIHTNDTPVSLKTKKLLAKKLEGSGFIVSESLDTDSELIVCIGGDGAFLEGIHKFQFPEIPFIGINTGHLGFFQEISPNQLADFIFHYKTGKYHLQTFSTVKATVFTENNQSFEHVGLNEIVIRGELSRSVHLNISIGGSFIERFSGDGILVSTPAGSTAYNYSLGGCIVDPRLKLMQVTPIAPMNTTAYRSFTSSILLPSDLSLGIIPDYETRRGIKITTDHLEYTYNNIDNINIEFSDKVVNLLRFENYDFWTKVKSKFL
ncbi:NAD(+)/NADH kinase [Aminipila luticellarii]|uniref:NAD kinase n=1 Tax=Aminipila luticellarii TaxID=2507160 RepID=A0A410PUM0_9FIRM|nr:NAD(+)/NADH kinase [Aminipila luticellarii]QAT42629.1 NAD(+)/NADH kinase [Aminipila luticellarii]